MSGALDATAGDALVSRVVNTAISIKPLFAVMKVAAKQVLKRTAERNGIPWDGTVRELQNTPEVLLLPALAGHGHLFIKAVMNPFKYSQDVFSPLPDSFRANAGASSWIVS